MSPFPNNPRKIKERIKRYEDDLHKEFKKFRYISDGSGKRYMIGPMYLLLGDVSGAIKSFEWFEKNFSAIPTTLPADCADRASAGRSSRSF